MEKKDIRAYTYEQLQEELSGIGEKAFRGKQIYEWLHVRLADSFDEMTNLSKALREKLEAILPQHLGQIAHYAGQLRSRVKQTFATVGDPPRGTGSQTGVEAGRDEQIPVPSLGR